jgi:hypothetical protein
MKPSIDEATQREERGDFIESFREEVEGMSLLDISDKADGLAKKYSQELDEDVRVFEIPM